MILYYIILLAYIIFMFDVINQWFLTCGPRPFGGPRY